MLIYLWVLSLHGTSENLMCTGIHRTARRCPNPAQHGHVSVPSHMIWRDLKSWAFTGAGGAALQAGHVLGTIMPYLTAYLTGRHTTPSA